MIERSALGDIQQIFCEMPQESNSLTLSLRGGGAITAHVTLDLGVHVPHDAVLNKCRRLQSNGGHCASFGKVPDVLDTVNAIGRCRFQPILLNAIRTKAALGN